MDRDVMFSPRVAPPIFGLGLLEAVAEETILPRADPDRLPRADHAPDSPGPASEELGTVPVLLAEVFRERGWRAIDVSGRAVEENASRILELHQRD